MIKFIHALPSFSPQPIKGQSQCEKCLSGYYCSSTNLTALTDENLCPPGKYCRSRLQEPESCPLGTFFNGTGAADPKECHPCPPGQFCNSTNPTRPADSCIEGYYCPESSQAARERPCEINSFCPAESAAALPCPAGQYCSRPNLPAPNRACDANYFCQAGQSRLCPPGHFCPKASPAPRRCSPGTFNPSPGRRECLECKELQFCGATGLLEPLGLCAARFKCPKGQVCIFPFFIILKQKEEERIKKLWKTRVLTEYE